MGPPYCAWRLDALACRRLDAISARAPVLGLLTTGALTGAGVDALTPRTTGGEVGLLVGAPKRRAISDCPNALSCSSVLVDILAL